MSDGKKRKRHTPEQVIAKLREADAMLSGGASVGHVLQALGGGGMTESCGWVDEKGGVLWGC